MVNVPSPSGVVEEEKIRKENIHSRTSSRELPVLSPSLTVCSLMSRAIQGGLRTSEPSKAGCHPCGYIF